MTNTMSCGCKIISDNLGAYKIEYCPEHGAADDMYEALQKVLPFIGAMFEEYPWVVPSMLQAVEQALAKAGERCIP